LLAKRSSTLVSFGILEKGSLVFLLGSFETGLGGNGGESLETGAEVVSETLEGFESASESLDDEDESEGESEDEGLIFLGPSESVALVSELITTFLLIFLGVGSLSESDEGSESELGKGTLVAADCPDAPESDSDEEVSLSEEMLAALLFLIFGVLSPELEFEFESELEDDDVSLSEDTEVSLEAFATGASSSELESELDEDEVPLEAGAALVFAFLVLGASESELESDAEDEEEELREALRFKTLILDFGEASFAVGISFSSSASLSELLEADDDETEDDFFEIFFAGGASAISTSLSSLLLLLLTSLLLSTVALTSFTDFRPFL